MSPTVLAFLLFLLLGTSGSPWGRWGQAEDCGSRKPWVSVRCPVEYYSAIKKTDVLVQVTTGMSTENIYRELKETQEDKYYMISLARDIQNKCLRHQTVHLWLLGMLCGRPTYTSRIVGGMDAAEGHWPWMVSVRMGSEHICGGSLISERWILTAAHCLTATWTFLTYTVWLGTTDADYLSQGLQHYVSQIVIHPNHKDKTADIALLKLYSRVTFTSLIRPICLPTISNQVTIPKSCWVTGWGKTDEYSDIDVSPTLQELEVAIIERKVCEQLYNPVGTFLPGVEPVIKNDMICAGGIKGMKDSCKGDSGGPLACYIDHVWIQIGVVSWGSDCARSLPGVYSSVLYYQRWINETISKAQYFNFSDFLFLSGLISLGLLRPSCALWV
ncbi:PREDICTED: serine protease 48-like [Elephantulus edwardii]|uniref:serine protease 48-like n=1 Tax=Elephantulus edwardii TaxID=28737 RepID=UPI0003F0B3D7|nr:PREDICTED: serine protease 48-like [Elephantulus edwardii]